MEYKITQQLHIGSLFYIFGFVNVMHYLFAWWQNLQPNMISFFARMALTGYSLSLHYLQLANFKAQL